MKKKQEDFLHQQRINHHQSDRKRSTIWETLWCRMCNERNETIFHIRIWHSLNISTACQLLSVQEVWNIDPSGNGYTITVKRTTDREKAKTLWEFSIQVDHFIQDPIPDIVVYGLWVHTRYNPNTACRAKKINRRNIVWSDLVAEGKTFAVSSEKNHVT